MTIRTVIVLALFWQAAAPSSSWTLQSSGVDVRFRGVSVVSDTVAWASGANGAVVRTVDGGRTWQTRSVAGAGKLDFRDVDATSELVAYVLSIGNGESSRIYKTIDGGGAWQLQFTNTDPKAFFDAMAFWDANRGIAVSDSVDGRFVVLTTTDGGRAWRHVPSDAFPPALPNEGFFAASGTNVTVLSGGRAWFGTGAASAARVLRSTDWGRTWAVGATPIPSGPSAGIFSIAFRDASHGIIVGGDYKTEGEAVNNAAVTTDGGVTWRLVRGLSGFRSAVAFVPRAASPSLVAVGPSGADYSSDDGKSWRVIDGAPGLHAFAFARRGRAGWGVGEKGVIARLDPTTLSR